MRFFFSAAQLGAYRSASSYFASAFFCLALLCEHIAPLLEWVSPVRAPLIGFGEFCGRTVEIPVFHASDAPRVVPRRQIWRERDRLGVGLLRACPVAPPVQNVCPESIAIHEPAFADEVERLIGLGMTSGAFEGGCGVAGQIRNRRGKWRVGKRPDSLPPLLCSQCSIAALVGKYRVGSVARRPI